jgi:outer membrane protein assembly factor BamE (lipoprotein component of BamABCDE complex)
MGKGLREIRVGAPSRGAAVAVLVAIGAAGCVGGIGSQTQHGYVVSDIAIEQVPVGSSKDQVLIALGSPSTTGNFGGEAYYYISQTRRQSAAFLPDRVVDQRVLAVYFDDNETVTRIADYGRKDGKIFDFVSRTTPTAGTDDNFLQQVLGGVVGGARNPFGGG